MASKSFTLTFLGDVMLGRLVDQLFPQHVNNTHDEEIAAHFVRDYPSILGNGNYTASSPWGTTLPLLCASDLTLINLETSVTTSSESWPQKKFNYRMHPSNLGPILQAAHVDYVSLANNHTLDFGTEGLVETVWTLKEAGVSFAGAGETTLESYRAAVLWLPRKAQEYHSRRVDGQKVLQSQQEQPQDHAYPVHVYSASDHPHDWNTVPTFHLIDYSSKTRVRLRRLLLTGGATTHPPENDYVNEDHEFHHRAHHHHQQSGSSSSTPASALKIFSIHWGPNYTWHPSDRIRALAHFLIDECGVDIVHGHSSHHVQGVERYHGKVIIYGCGDFVDDYTMHEDFRNDLGAVWRVTVKEKFGSEQDDNRGVNENGLSLDRLEIFPMRIDRFRAMLLDVQDKDHWWVWRKIEALSADLGTLVRDELGDQGQVIIDLDADLIDV